MDRGRYIRPCRDCTYTAIYTTGTGFRNKPCDKPDKRIRRYAFVGEKTAALFSG